MCKTVASLVYIEEHKNEEITMEERIITEQEECAIRLCHHEHDGYPVDDAARVMGITPAKVKALLRSVKRKAPQLFPILTPRQRVILDSYSQCPCSNHCSPSRAAIAATFGITVAVLAKEVAFLRRHKFLVNQTTEQFDPVVHDGMIKEVF